MVILYRLIINISILIKKINLFCICYCILKNIKLKNNAYHVGISYDISQNFILNFSENIKTRNEGKHAVTKRQKGNCRNLSFT